MLTLAMFDFLHMVICHPSAPKVKADAAEEEIEEFKKPPLAVPRHRDHLGFLGSRGC